MPISLEFGKHDTGWYCNKDGEWKFVEDGVETENPSPEALFRYEAHLWSEALWECGYPEELEEMVAKLMVEAYERGKKDGQQ